MKKFLRPNLRLDQEGTDSDHAKFSLGPLERGFAITLGNAIRRTLLSATPGAAVYAVKIENATHEFTALEGVAENVSKIILNVKNLIISIDDEIINSDEKIVLSLEASKPGSILAQDIVCPAGVNILNLDQQIATLAKNHTLNMEFYVKKARGYRTFTENKMEADEFGAIAIDSNYSPIKKVAYGVGRSKINNEGEYETLVIELTTNGSITPVNAIAMASKILSSHLDLIAQLSQQAQNAEIIADKISNVNNELDIPIEELDFTVRSYNCLKRININTLRDLTQRSESELMGIRNFGKKSFLEIKDKLQQLGLSFKDEQ